MFYLTKNYTLIIPSREAHAHLRSREYVYGVTDIHVEIKYAEIKSKRL